MTDETKAVRNKAGQFVKGQSGNPRGRPKGTRNQIVALRENTELALRDYMSTPENARKALKALDHLFDNAANGDTAALKLLLDKALPNARAGSDDGESQKAAPVAISIVNQTAEHATSPVRITTLDEDGNVIEE